MKKIDVEAHFLTDDYVKYMHARKEFPKLEAIEDEGHRKFEGLWFEPDYCHAFTLEVINRLLDLGEGRLKEMDAAGIDMQVLSLSDPGCELFKATEATAITRKINNELSRVTKRHPDRFIGLATLAPQDPSAAADELNRAVTELGFRGGKVNSNVQGEYLDDQKYWGIFETAEKLGVPIYLHPMIPSPSMRKPYMAYGGTLAGPSLGFGAETALHAMRLICSGLFDKYPGLTIILGHLGEALPFWLHRIDLSWSRPTIPGRPRPKCLKKPSEYIKTNFIMTTSGMFFLPAFLCVYLALGADNIALAIDYPFEKNEPAGQFMDALPICETDKEKVCHITAERVFKLK